MFVLSVDDRMEEGRDRQSAEPVVNPPRYQEHDPTSKRTIALFIAALSGGGAPRNTLTLAHAFAARGHEVHLVVVRPYGPLRSELLPCIRLVTLESRIAGLPIVRDIRRLQVQVSIPTLARYLREERPDVLLSAASHVNLPAVWARRLARTGTRLVLCASNPIWRSAWNMKRRPRPLLPVFARLFYPWADAFIAVSEAVAADLSRVTGIPRERIITIPNPVVTPEFEEKARAPLDHPWFQPGQPPVALSVGRLVAQKDFPTLLRAFARLRATRPVRLMILGDSKGGRRAQLAALAEQLRVADDVELPGYIGNPYPYMARSAVFVLSSAWEGFGLVLVEAMACGCPVVSTDCPGAPAEILGGGLYGPLVPVGDDRALATAIASVLDSPPRREQLRARAQEYGIDQAADRYLEVLLGHAGPLSSVRS